MSDRSTDHGYRPLGWALALAILALWSCGTPEERYKTLSFFFDGVPLPESMRPEVEGDGNNSVALVVVTHAPYAAERCSECHGEIGQFSMSLAGYSGVKASVCLKCHEGTQTEFQHMHGPVASIQCLACHEPHESRYEHLLSARAPKLCLDCHMGEDLQASGSAEHADLTTDCLNCHLGHGGNDPSFLRMDLSPPAPADAAPPQSDPPKNSASECGPADSETTEPGSEARP